MHRKLRKIRIIINPAAGRGESVLPIINAAMGEAGIEWEASITHHANDATRLAKAAVKEGIDALAVYGGDGTLAEAISGLMGSEIPLAILPGGSANAMATELGIPTDLKEACLLLSHGPLETRAIDVGKFGEHHFIVRMSIGFEADVVKGAERQTKNQIGIFAYFLSAVAALKITKRTTYRVKIDGHMHRIQGLTCIIANTGNLGFSSTSLDKHIDVSDGLLDVVVVRKANIGLFFHMVVTLLRRVRPDNLELVEHWQGKVIDVSASPRQAVQCDGEMLGRTPLHIKIIPGAIRVLVPRKTQSH